MSPHRSGVFSLLGLALVAPLLTAGCNIYKQPTAEAPHATVIGYYLGGEFNEETGYYHFGYLGGATVCKGKKEKCSKYVDSLFEGRKLPFRIPAGREVSITPLGIVDRHIRDVGLDKELVERTC